MALVDLIMTKRIDWVFLAFVGWLIALVLVFTVFLVCKNITCTEFISSLYV